MDLILFLSVVDSRPTITPYSDEVIARICLSLKCECITIMCSEVSSTSSLHLRNILV